MDAVAKRYGVLPSDVLGVTDEMAPYEIYRFNTKIAVIGIEEEVRQQKLAELRSKKRGR